VFRFLRRRRNDPRADELRRKLAESREAEVTEEPAPEDLETRRSAVHEAGRDTVERMRRG
jgi:hypothetical protein